MKNYEELVKSRNTLPDRITLHDAVITDCKLEEKDFALIFGKGFMFVQSDRNAAEQWAEYGKVVFEDVDDDFCEFNVLENKKFRTYELQRLRKLIKKESVHRFEIVDEYYNYSSAMLCGYFWCKNKLKQFQIKLHYFGDMIYRYKRER